MQNGGYDELVNRLLINEYPLIVLPSLAEKIGLNEAIILQQVHFWLGKKQHFKDGKYWIYNTYDEWVKQFPFWSKSTIRRAITSLEKQELLIVGNYNKAGFDNTKWYTINYLKLESMSRPSVQNEQTECSKWTDATAQNEQTYTIDYTETNYIDSSSSGGEGTENPFKFYEHNFGVLSPFMTESIEQWCEDLSEELVVESMKLALKAGKKFNYAEGIMRSWLRNNIKTLDDVRAAEVEFENRKTNKHKTIDDIDWDNL